jgi:membrane protease YdiL (CAAX protease family)
VVAIVLSTVFFVALHLANSGLTALALVNLALCGVLFGLAVWKLDSPWAAFGLHASWNFTQAVLFGLPNSGGTTPFAIFGVTPGTTPAAGFAYDPGFGIEGSAMATVVLIAGCALLWWLGERRGVRPTDLWVDAGADGLGGPECSGDPATAAGSSGPTAENIAIS